MRRAAAILLPFLVLVAAAVVAIGYRNAHAFPVVRRATILLADWPAGARPVTVALVSDIHIGNVQMDRARLSHIADRVTAMRPDLIVLAGDFVAGHDAATARAVAADLAAGVRRFRAPLGVIAVPGNHDHWTDIVAVRRALAAAGVRVIANGAVAAGPLSIAGLDDLSSDHLQLWPAIRDQRRLRGARIMVSHSPDIAPWVGRHDAGMPILAGHTHCGQAVFPVIGAPFAGSAYGDRYRCGLIREGRRTIVVSAGLGTSVVPLRYGTTPDYWLVTFGPRPGISRSRS